MSMFLREDTPGRTAIHKEDFFSVAIVSFNRFDKLKQCIESIHKYADMPFEICVSDDGGALYNDFNFIRDIKDKISHVAVNLGRNKGLHVNANNAVSLTRSKYVLLINDDLVIKRPFMRDCVNLLKHAPYIGSIYMESSYHVSKPEHHDAAGTIECITPGGQKYLLSNFVGAMSPVFRKEYWYEVGGYAEDDIYGDLPFNNKGFLRGYFTAFLEGESRSFDTDKGGPGGTSFVSTGRFIDVGYCNYPKLFGITAAQQLAMDRERCHQCSKRSGDVRRSGDFNEGGPEGWYDYMKEVTKGGVIHWDILESKYHGRFLDSLKKDVLSRYNK